MSAPARTKRRSGLEDVLGYVFSDRRQLERAVTHSSLAYEKATGRSEGREADASVSVESDEDNEQLEFLGDAVLGLIAAEGLFRAYPELHEGDLTRLRSRLVSRKHLGQVATRMDLGNYLKLGRGEERSGGRQKAVLLANALEAVIAAVYLDGGMKAAEQVVRRWIVEPYAPVLREALNAGQAMGDHKSALQEWLQAHRCGGPRYEVRAESGPDHRKQFTVEVLIETADGRTERAQGVGSTKKKAEQEAAKRIYKELLRGAEEATPPVSR